MIVLDTNVVSELMRATPEPEVLAWLDDQPTSTLFVTTITEAEILTGIAILPDGRRRRGLTGAAERAFGVFFAERILSFDSAAAHAYASIAARSPRHRQPDQSGRLPDLGGSSVPRSVCGDPRCERLSRLRDRGD